jgi:hypothetical protein
MRVKREVVIFRGQWQSAEVSVDSDCAPPGTSPVRLLEICSSWSRAGGGGHERLIGGNKRTLSMASRRSTCHSIGRVWSLPASDCGAEFTRRGPLSTLGLVYTFRHYRCTAFCTYYSHQWPPRQLNLG